MIALAAAAILSIGLATLRSVAAGPEQVAELTLAVPEIPIRSIGKYSEP
jgi:hypothetical protein